MTKANLPDRFVVLDECGEWLKFGNLNVKVPNGHSPWLIGDADTLDKCHVLVRLTKKTKVVEPQVCFDRHEWFDTGCQSDDKLCKP